VGINWATVRGESGPDARLICRDWVIDLRDKYVGDGIPFFFKQWGGFNKKKAGWELVGHI
jgi:protein gp37